MHQLLLALYLGSEFVEKRLPQSYVWGNPRELGLADQRVKVKNRR